MIETGSVCALFSLGKEIPERLRGYGNNLRCLILSMSARIIILPVARLFRTICMLKPNPKRPRRIETRRALICHDLDWLNARHDWPGLKTIGKVIATREKEGKTTTQTR